MDEGLLDKVSKEIEGEHIMRELDLTIAEIVKKNCQKWEQEGIQKGIQEGRQEGIKEVVLKFLNADMSCRKSISNHWFF